MNQPGLATDAAAEQRARMNAGIAQWSRRRPWTRTDSARWLNDRAPTVMAWLRRRPGSWPEGIDHIGYWLKDRHTDIFNAAHGRLAGAKTADARDALHVGDVINP